MTAPSVIREGLRVAYEGEVSALARQLPASVRSREELTASTSPEDTSQAPLVRLVDLLLRTAVEGGASDLHVEQGAGEVVVRERVDGILRRVTELPAAARTSLLTRVKVMAGMDISVKRRPQDGGFPFSVGGRTLSIRVSTLPVEGGEKAVLRILDPRAAPDRPWGSWDSLRRISSASADSCEVDRAWFFQQDRRAAGRARLSSGPSVSWIEASSTW